MDRVNPPCCDVQMYQSDEGEYLHISDVCKLLLAIRDGKTIEEAAEMAHLTQELEDWAKLKSK